MLQILVELSALYGGAAEIPTAVERLPGPDGQLIDLGQEARDQLQRAVAKLPPRMRSCVELRLQLLGYQEIAETLELSPQTVRTQIFMARRRLRHSLGIAEDLGGSRVATAAARTPQSAPAKRNAKGEF